MLLILPQQYLCKRSSPHIFYFGKKLLEIVEFLRQSLCLLFRCKKCTVPCLSNNNWNVFVESSLRLPIVQNLENASSLSLISLMDIERNFVATRGHWTISPSNRVGYLSLVTCGFMEEELTDRQRLVTFHSASCFIFPVRNNGKEYMVVTVGPLWRQCFTSFNLPTKNNNTRSHYVVCISNGIHIYTYSIHFIILSNKKTVSKKRKYSLELVGYWLMVINT